MEIRHPSSPWCLVFTDGHATGPQRLLVGDSALFSFMHCRVDGVSDDALIPALSHHYHKAGCAVFEGAGAFGEGTPARLGETLRVAANAARLTYDLAWPKDTPLKSGFEAGSLVLRGNWQRFFLVTPEADASGAPEWRDLPAQGESPISLSPVPAAIVLENAAGQRLEVGLGDDLWRWSNGLNGEFLHGIGKLELSRSGSNFSLRRWVTLCDPEAEAKAAAKLDAKRAADFAKRQKKAAQEGKELTAPAPVPVSQPEARPYRFNAYFAWSAPELAAAAPADLPVVPVGPNGLARADLEALGAAPRLRLDLATLPLPENARRARTALPCWEARATQRLFRRVIRQLADFAREGTLALDGLTPGWCDIATHANRSGTARHWDLSAILDTAAWARQTLGPGWTIAVPQTGFWSELPSLAALAAESGFRNQD